MSREIKLRAWRKDLKCMVPWDTLLLSYELHEIFQDPDIVPLLCTGLNDKNGKEIYEGDILSWEKGTGEVSYDSYMFRVNGFYDPSQDIPWDIFAEGAEYKVIGNIYENPELMKGINEPTYTRQNNRAT
jgi:uncharacterized phage protein (TIGR01671 family)